MKCFDCGIEITISTLGASYPSGNQKCKRCFSLKQELNTECLVYSRITGYISPTIGWNKGKTQEWKMRKTYKLA